jgi:putative membrane protein
MSDKNIIKQATFNPRLKTYFFIVGILIGLIPIIGWIFMIFWLLGVGVFWTKKYYASLEAVLYDDSLYFKKGVFFTLEKTIPLENIQDLTFREGPLLKYLGLAVINIETAGGQGNRVGGDLTLIGVEDAREFREQVLSQRSLHKKGESTSPGKSPFSDGEVLHEMLATLKRIEKNLEK